MSHIDLDRLLPVDLCADGGPAIERVPIEPDPEGSSCPPAFRNRLLVDVIHDGNVLPARFLRDADGSPIADPEALHTDYVSERDWGAELIAAHLASALHLHDYVRVNRARVLLDFGRFPGITPPSADFMRRFAINYPFSTALDYVQKKVLLEAHYDRISEGMDAAIRDKLVKIAIHTYDEHNANRTRRPPVSILTRSLGHQKDFGMPVGLFDPAFPDVLAEFTADRILRSRLALTLEEAAIHAADNYPYALPEGSVEVRSQVWFFFRHVQLAYEAAFGPDPERDRNRPSPRSIVWDMLLDTNLRSADSEALRSYLHMYRHPPAGLEAMFDRARAEYERIVAFIGLEDGALVNNYRNSVDRPSSILIEVRKDLVWRFDEGRPIGPRADDARLIARILANAVRTYLIADRPAKAIALAQRDARYH